MRVCVCVCVCVIVGPSYKLSSKKMALITSDCAATRSPSINRLQSPRILCPKRTVRMLIDLVPELVKLMEPIERVAKTLGDSL